MQQHSIFNPETSSSPDQNKSSARTNTKTDHMKSNSLRFYVQILDKDYLNVDLKKVDNQYKNPLQDMNLQLSIVYRDFISPESDG